MEAASVTGVVNIIVRKKSHPKVSESEETYVEFETKVMVIFIWKSLSGVPYKLLARFHNLSVCFRVQLYVYVLLWAWDGFSESSTSFCRGVPEKVKTSVQNGPCVQSRRNMRIYAVFFLQREWNSQSPYVGQINKGNASKMCMWATYLAGIEPELQSLSGPMSPETARNDDAKYPVWLTDAKHAHIYHRMNDRSKRERNCTHNCTQIILLLSLDCLKIFTILPAALGINFVTPYASISI